MKYKVWITWSCDRHDNSTDDDIFEVDDLEKYLPSLVGKIEYIQRTCGSIISIKISKVG